MSIINPLFLGNMKETIEEVDIRLIYENPHQPRRFFASDDLEELAASIQEIGLIHPPAVRKVDKKFELIAGERRLRALKLLGKERIPVVVREISSSGSAHSALIENIQRVDLNVMEVAFALKELMGRLNITQEELADKVGKKRSTVANYLRLLQLPEEIQSLLRNQTLTMGHAKAVFSLPRMAQHQLCQAIIKENLSVREAEARARRLLKVKTRKKFEDVHLTELKNQLEKQFGTKVEISDSKIVFDYYGWEDLDRILELMGAKISV